MRVDRVQLEYEIGTWREFLNVTIGWLAIAGGLGCLGLAHRENYALMTLFGLTLTCLVRPTRVLHLINDPCC